MAARRPPDLLRLDVAAFARGDGELDGAVALAELRRLHDVVMPPSDGAPAPTIMWKIAGQRAALGGAGLQAALRIRADAALPLQCQRCLQAVEVVLHVDRRIFFVEGEDAAAALDAESDDDVLAVGPSLDVRSLIEDELLLALPIVPRHEVCPHPLQPGVPALEAGDAADADAPAHPFAALAALKRGLPN